MLKKGVVFFLLVIAMVNLVYADFSIGNLSHSMQSEYGPNETLKGWVNISFNYERSNSKFFDSQNNSISILDIIKKNPTFNHTCNTQECSSDYSTSEESEIKTFYLYKDVDKTIGFELLGVVRGIESIDFTITSNAPPSCKNPLKVDILGDGVIELSSNASSSQICSESKEYGCFNINASTKEYILGRTPYCQKFTLPEAPGFRVGAWVKKIGSESAKLTILLFEGDQSIAKCDLPDASPTGEEVFCDLDFFVTNPKTYYLCIRAAESNLYKIKANQVPEKKCGFYGIPVWPETNAYQISYQTRKFNGFPITSIKDALPNGRKVSALVWNYILEKYGSGSCLEGCIIPLVVKSGENQSITFRDLKVLYQTSGGLEDTEVFYNLAEAPAKVSSNFQKLFFNEAGFVLPGGYGIFEYNLNLNGEDIFTEDMETIKIPIIKDLNPKIIGLEKSTNFTVEVESDKNITEYVWKTPDKIKTTTTNNVAFTFNTLGLTNISVSVKDSENYTAMKIFDIYIYSPEKQINKKISETKVLIQMLKDDAEQYPVFYKNNILNEIDLKNTEDLIADIEDKYSIASTATEYLEIITALESINLPESISTTGSADNVIFLPKKENIRLEYLEDAGGGSYESENEEKYLEALISWHQQNMDVKLDFKEISASDEGGIEPLLRFFELDIGGNLDSRPYLIIEDLSNLKFDRDYGEVDGGGFYYLELDAEQTIIFSTTQDVNFMYLPAYISPPLEDLDVGAIPGNGGDGDSKWIFFILIILFIIVVGFIVYIILQEWYKNKYETHLFKDRNNLFNLLQYINNEKRKGLSNAEIVKKLKKAKWNSEQIDYALKKYEGKRTGMYEIPLLNIFKKNPQKPEYRGHFGLPSRGFPPRKRL